MDESFDALIIDPDPESRMRLRQATAVCPEFRSIKFAGTLLQAMEQIKEKGQCNIIFIAQTFASAESQAFVTEARQTLHGGACAYIMVLNGANQTRTRVALNLTSGMDGFLFQPFSADALKETTEIASRVRAAAQLEKQNASKELLLNSIVPSIDKIIEGHLAGKPMRVEKADLKSIARTLCGLYDGNTAGYMNALSEAFMAVEPPAPPESALTPRWKRKKRARPDEATSNEAHLSEQRQGGYMMRKR